MYSTAFLTNAKSRSWSPVYDNKSVDGTRSWMPTTEVALREELEKAQSKLKVLASQHKENSSSISASLSVKSSDPSSGISEQVASLREGLDRLTNEVRAYANVVKKTLRHLQILLDSRCV